MQRFGGVVRDTAGNSLSNTSVRVNLAGTSTLATIFSDDAFTAQANPFTSEVDGSWKFYAAPGRYDVVYTKTGFTFGTAPTFDQLSYDYMSVVTPSTITANQNNYLPTNGLNVEIWRLSSDASRTITGIDATTAVSGQSLTIFNVGSFPIVFANENAGSTAANRILTGGSDVTVPSNQSILLKYDTTTDRWRAIVVPIVSSSSNLAEQLSGLELSNAVGDPTNDITVSVGACTSDDAAISSREFMSLTSALTKQLDVNWVVGNNQGGLDTGAIANGTYHVFVIKRLDTGVVDVLFSTSPTAPTLPASYTKFRRIGSILREAATIIPFNQFGDEFWRDTPVLDVDAANPGTAAVTRTLSVPTGIKVLAIMNAMAHLAGGGNVSQLYLSSLDSTDMAASRAAAPLGTVDTGGTADAGGQTQARVWTNTSAQIRSRLSASTANNSVRIATLGWLDRRGRG